MVWFSSSTMSVTQLFSGESCIQNILRCLPKTICILLCQSAEAHSFIVDKLMEGILSLWSLLFVSTFAHLLLLLCSLDVLDFPQTQSAKLQRLSTKEDKQQPLSCNKILFWKQLSWYIANHGTHQWWQLLQAAKGTWMQISWSTIIKVKTPFNLWEFSISGETDQEFTFKDVYYSPSIFLGPHPIPSQVSWFPPHVQRSNKTMRKYRAVNSLSRNFLWAYFWQFRAK